MITMCLAKIVSLGNIMVDALHSVCLVHAGNARTNCPTGVSCITEDTWHFHWLFHHRYYHHDNPLSRCEGHTLDLVQQDSLSADADM